MMLENLKHSKDHVTAVKKENSFGPSTKKVEGMHGKADKSNADAKSTADTHAGGCK